ncbi:MAG: hypothetical protein ACE5IO_09270 [Thermoplasmata archaeon]
MYDSIIVGSAADIVNARTVGGGPGTLSSVKAVDTCLELIESGDWSQEASERYPGRCRSTIRELRFGGRFIGLLEEKTSFDFGPRRIAESLVRMSAIASLSL